MGRKKPSSVEDKSNAGVLTHVTTIQEIAEMDGYVALNGADIENGLQLSGFQALPSFGLVVLGDSLVHIREGNDRCHNKAPHTGSQRGSETAANKWPWQSLSQKALREFTQFAATGGDAQVVLTAQDVKARILDIQCGTCRQHVLEALTTCIREGQISVSKRITFGVERGGTQFVLKEGLDAGLLGHLGKLVTSAAVSKRGGKKAGGGDSPSAVVEEEIPSSDAIAIDAGRDLIQCVAEVEKNLQLPSSDSRYSPAVEAMLQGLVAKLERVSELCETIQESNDGGKEKGEIDWNPRFPHCLQSVDQAMAGWLRQLTDILVHVGCMQSVAFMTGSLEDVKAMKALSEDLWQSYDNTLSALLNIILLSREEQRQLTPQPAMMALFLARNLRQSITRTLQRKYAELSMLHSHVYSALTSDATRALLMRTSSTYLRWEQCVVGDRFCNQDENARTALGARLQLFVGDPYMSSGNCDPVTLDQQHDVQLSRAVLEWEETLKVYKEDMLARVQAELAPSLYPQSPALTAAFKQWVAEFEAEWADIEQKKTFQSHVSQNEVTVHNYNFTKVKQQLKQATEELEKQSKARTKREGGAAASGEFSKGSDAEMVLSDRIQALNLEKQLSHQKQLGVKLQYRTFMVRQLHRRHWLTREFVAQFSVRTGGVAQQRARLCGKEPEAMNRLKIILAHVMMDKINSVCDLWGAKRMEKQLLEAEVAAESMRRKKDEASAKKRLEKEEKQKLQRKKSEKQHVEESVDVPAVEESDDSKHVEKVVHEPVVEEVDADRVASAELADSSSKGDVVEQSVAAVSSVSAPAMAVEKEIEENTSGAIWQELPADANEEEWCTVTAAPRMKRSKARRDGREREQRDRPVDVSKKKFEGYGYHNSGSNQQHSNHHNNNNSHPPAYHNHSNQSSHSIQNSHNNQSSQNSHSIQSSQVHSQRSSSGNARGGTLPPSENSSLGASPVAAIKPSPVAATKPSPVVAIKPSPPRPTKPSAVVAAKTSQPKVRPRSKSPPRAPPPTVTATPVQQSDSKATSSSAADGIVSEEPSVTTATLLPVATLVPEPITAVLAVEEEKEMSSPPEGSRSTSQTPSQRKEASEAAPMRSSSAAASQTSAQRKEASESVSVSSASRSNSSAVVSQSSSQQRKDASEVAPEVEVPEPAAVEQVKEERCRRLSVEDETADGSSPEESQSTSTEQQQECVELATEVDKDKEGVEEQQPDIREGQDQIVSAANGWNGTGEGTTCVEEVDIVGAERGDMRYDDDGDYADELLDAEEMAAQEQFMLAQHGGMMMPHQYYGPMGPYGNGMMNPYGQGMPIMGMIYPHGPMMGGNMNQMGMVPPQPHSPQLQHPQQQQAGMAFFPGAAGGPPRPPFVPNGGPESPTGQMMRAGAGASPVVDGRSNGGNANGVVPQANGVVDNGAVVNGNGYYVPGHQQHMGHMGMQQHTHIHTHMMGMPQQYMYPGHPYMGHHQQPMQYEGPGGQVVNAGYDTQGYVAQGGYGMTYYGPQGVTPFPQQQYYNMHPQQQQQGYIYPPQQQFGGVGGGKRGGKGPKRKQQFGGAGRGEGKVV